MNKTVVRIISIYLLLGCIFTSPFVIIFIGLAFSNGLPDFSFIVLTIGYIAFVLSLIISIFQWKFYPAILISFLIALIGFALELY